MNATVSKRQNPDPNSAVAQADSEQPFQLGSARSSQQAAGSHVNKAELPSPFSSVYEEHRRAVYYLALRLLGEQQKAEDATHDVV